MFRLKCAGVLLASIVLFSCGGSNPSGGADAMGGEGVGSGADGPAPADKCESNEDCPDGFCSPIKGVCVECTVNEHCAEEEKCVGGYCLGDVACSPGTFACDPSGKAMKCNDVGTGYMSPESCDDKVECTLDTCADGSGCVHSPNDNACEDGNPCTLDACLQDKGCTSEPDPECGTGGLADATPMTLTFPPTVPSDQMTNKNVVINNLGLGTLVIFEAKIVDEFGVFFFYDPPYSPTQKVFDPPIQVEPGKGASLALAFAPEELGAFQGTLKVYTNDLTREGGEVTVPLKGQAVADNCVMSVPQTLEFGPRVVGVTHTLNLKVKNCGDGLVPVYKVGMMSDSDPQFSLAAGLTPPYDLDLEQSTTVTIGFNPTEPDKSYSATLRVENGAPMMPNLDVPIFGSGIAGDAQCPISVVTYNGDALEPPFEPVAFSGSDSYPLAGNKVITYAWDVEAPAGAHPQFEPSDTAPTVLVTPEVCGEYLFKLKVWDDLGNEGCNTATRSVKVLPEDDIYLELVWFTPGDANELDEGPGKGADLDLHFVSPLGNGPDADGDGEPDGWFDSPNDCYWQEPNPEWGGIDPGVDDDPQMAVADMDGAGPEVVYINKPSSGVYRVAVHYFNDNDFGDSFAKVRVYVKQGKAFESDFVKLENRDMWDVARITVEGIAISVKPELKDDGTLDITPNYSSPLLPL